jgi:hypothetical protein
MPRSASRGLGFAAIAVLVALTSAGCGASTQGTRQSCVSYGIHAIRLHRTVRTVPPACAGLTHAQLNAAVSSAIRQAVGPRHKAQARRLALLDGRYLASLVTTLRPGAPAVLPAGSGPPQRGLTVSIAALSSWGLTALAGSYLYARSRRRGRDRPVRSGPGVVLIHVSAAVAGLAALAAFAVADRAALAWASVGLLATTAGLGMATLVNWLPDPGPDRIGDPVAAGPPAASRAQSMVAMIAVHGLLASATLLLVVLAAIGGA